MYGAAEALREVIRNPLAPFDCTEYDRGVAAACAQLDEAAFAAVWAEGGRCRWSRLCYTRWKRRQQRSSWLIPQRSRT